eukprot:15366198-Ditylum_brightwellii.AAC.4
MNPTDKQNEDLYNAILTVYHKFKEVPVNECQKIPKLKWSAKSKKLAVAAGKEATRVANEYLIDEIGDLNALYFATAFTVSPSKPCSKGSKRATSDISYDEKLLKSIEYLCKKLGKYRAINKKDELSDSDKEYLSGKDSEELVVSTRMKLAADTCRLWKLKEKNNRTNNNKLLKKVTNASMMYCKVPVQQWQTHHQKRRFQSSVKNSLGKLQNIVRKQHGYK